jgi:hypothetical protein
MHIIIITYLIKASTRNVIRKKMCQLLGLLQSPVWKAFVKHFVTYSPDHRQAGAPTINIQSTLRTAPDLCKTVSLQCYLVTTVIHIQSVHRYVCIHTFFTIWRRWSGKRNKIIRTAVNAACLGNLYVCHRLGSPALYGWLYVYRIPNCVGPSG